MSIDLLRRAVRAGVLRSAIAALLAGCGPSAPDAGSVGPQPRPSGKPAAAGAEQRPRIRPQLVTLGPDERRVALVVVPGDASVEVDGQPAHRRNGAIDLTGNVGEVRRVRVWKGPRTTDEKAVTIQEGRPSPSTIDLNEAPPVRPGGEGPRKVASYGGFDD